MKKKFITVGATTLTALTILGAAQPMAHAAQIHKINHQNTVKMEQKVGIGDDAVVIKGTSGLTIGVTAQNLVCLGNYSSAPYFWPGYTLEVTKVDSSKIKLSPNDKGEFVDDGGNKVELETGDIFRITFGEDAEFQDEANGMNAQYTGEKSFKSGKKYAFTVNADGSVHGVDEKALSDATAAVNGLFKDGAAATQLGSKVYKATIAAALDKVLILNDSEPEKDTLIKKIGTALDLHLVAMEVDSTKKIFPTLSGKASDYIGKVFTDSTHNKLRSGYVASINVLVKGTEGQYAASITNNMSRLGTFTTFMNDLTKAKKLADVPETAAQDLVDALFKDTTYDELNTGIKVANIESARKAVSALNDSAEKSEMLKRIGDAYGMYFIVDAKAMKAGDPLGDKVKADANMKNLHDFVEAATDFEADMTKAKSSKSAAGTYDYVRSGWSKAVATAQSCVNAYVAGTDLSQAGLGDFSTDVANLNTAANAIQGDQNDVANDKVEVEYNYTAQAPGEPGWYGVVPSAVTLTDANRGIGEVANVELKNATQVGGNYVPYDGGKTVEVFVKSDNSYKLNDGKGDPTVDYKLNFVDGTGTHDVPQNAMEHKIGEMKAGDTTIVAHVDLVGNATKSGKYVDNLFYHFSEK